jgi:hypothetical protein
MVRTTTTTARPAVGGVGGNSRKRSRSLRATSAGAARLRATLRTTEGRTRRARNAQSAASNANILTPRVAASVSPKTLMLLLLPPPQPLPPLRNRGQREGRRRGLLRHMPGSEPTQAHQDVQIMYGATPGGYTLPFSWSIPPFCFMYPVLARSP